VTLVAGLFALGVESDAVLRPSRAVHVHARLPYLAAALSHLAPSLQPDYAYRIVASKFACLGPATLFVFVFYFSRSRWWALASGDDDSSRPKLAFGWSRPSELHVQGPIPGGQLVSVQVNYDPGWRAEQDGRSIAIERDGLGYLLLRANASPAARISASAI